MTDQQYKVVSVRLNKEEADFLQRKVDAKEGLENFQRMSNLLRFIIREWISENE